MPMPASVTAVSHAATLNVRLSSTRHTRSTSAPTNTANAGKTGKTYPGSFDSENEKNSNGTTAQIHASASNESREFLSDRSRAIAGIRKKIHGASPAIATRRKK